MVFHKFNVKNGLWCTLPVTVYFSTIIIISIIIIIILNKKYILGLLVNSIIHHVGNWINHSTLKGPVTHDPKKYLWVDGREVNGRQSTLS